LVNKKIGQQLAWVVEALATTRLLKSQVLCLPCLYISF